MAYLVLAGLLALSISITPGETTLNAPELPELIAPGLPNGFGYGFGSGSTPATKKEVKVKMTINNVDFAKLDDKGKDELKSGVQKSLAATAGVEESDVLVTLSAGSVKVDAVIQTSESTPASAITEKVEAGDMASKVSEVAKAIPSVVKAATGPIDVKAPEIKTITTEVAPPPVPRMEGDPHATNLRGERFDITKVGTYSLIFFPLGEVLPDLDVKVSVKRLQGKVCESAFIEHVSVEGNWLGNVSRLTFSAGPLNKPSLRLSQFIATAAGKKWEYSESLKTGQRILISQQSAQRPHVSLRAIQGTSVTGKPVETFRTTFGDAFVDVQHVSHRHISYLNVDIQGLEHVKAKIGGILGLDRHDEATLTPAGCHHKTRKSAQLSDLRLEENDDSLRSWLGASY